jgi:hypothetical protein
MNLKPVAFATLIALTTVACGDQTPTTQSNTAPSAVTTEVPSGGIESPKPAPVTPAVKPSPNLPSNSSSKPQNLTGGSTGGSTSSTTSQAPAAPSEPAVPQAAPPKTESPAEVPLRPTEPATGPVKMGDIKYESSETAPDPEIEQAIVESLNGDRSALQKTRYYYDRIDLNGDGNSEALVYLSGSYTCGSGGCMMLVLTPSGQRYDMVSQMTLVRAPIIVSDEKSAGWKDLVLEVSGGGAQKHYARMQFDGGAYPGNPSTAPEVAPNTTINGTAVMNEGITADGGIALQGEG